MLTDEEVVLMRRVMADALTIKPGERAVELVVDGQQRLFPIVVKEPWVFDRFTGEWMCGATSWYGSIHQTDGGDRVTVFSQSVLKLDANDVCPVLLDFDEKFVADSMEKVARACRYRDYETMRQVGIHHANDKERQQSRVLRDKEEEDEELVDFDIEWVNPVYVVAEPIAQPNDDPYAEEAEYFQRMLRNATMELRDVMLREGGND